MKNIRYLLLCGVVFLVVGFGKNDNENRWIAHTILNSPFKQTCIVKIIEANSRDEAELKFDIYIEEQEKILGAKQKDKSAYAVAPLVKGLKIEHELKGFMP